MNELSWTTIQQADSACARSAVVILGMHRSGSSALSGFIHLLGADAPAHMSRPDDFNARGYWESSAIRLFNDRVLQSVGSDWKDWGPFDFEQAALKVQDWDSELAELIRQEFGESPLLVVKDPRLCRMAPILLRTLERLAIAPKIVLTVRNPLECAKSLQERDHMSREEALLLWLRHVLDAEKASRGYRRCFVAFDDLLDDWRRVSNRLATSLDLVWPKSSAEAGEAIDAFLSGNLRHHRIGREDLGALEPMLTWVQSVYDILLELARDAELSDARIDHLDEIRRNFDAIAPAIRSIIRNRDHLAREAHDRESAAQQQVTRLDTRLQQLSARAQAEAETARQQAAQSKQEAEIHRSKLEAAQADLAAQKQEIESYRSKLEVAQADLAAQKQEAENYRSKLEVAQADLAAQKQEFDRIRSELELRLRALQAEDSDAWRDLIQARLALHKVLGKGRGRHRSRLWRTLVAKPRTSKAEREKRQAGLIRASGLFDPEWYLSRYPDVRESGMDPVLHYLRHGCAEQRDPSPRFSTGAYLRRHLDVASARMNPLVHFLEFGIDEKRQIEPAERGPSSAPATEPMNQEPSGAGVTAEHLKFTRHGPQYEDFDPTILTGATPDVKLLAFYLPQFHAIPENDQNWGQGFTEWRQIVRGLPRFPGHYQPRVPRDLGFYDLTDPNVMRRQIALAKAAGIYGFGFYYYWFDSHRVLDQPIETFLASPDMDMPFMAIWANENWTRTWDGMSGEILLQQSYDPQHEPALLADLARHFRDPRYIRFGERPFFVIYQPRHVPDARETFARWRMRWKSEFGLEPLIFMAQTFGVEDPREFGLDGAIEFPPHKVVRPLPGRPTPDAFNSEFAARVVSYDDVASVSLEEPEAPFPLIKTIVPGWDNDARRPMRGTIIEASTPTKYENWLHELVKRVKAKPVLGESIVAVNAWNEWAEAAYLEPDLYFGSAYLNATARALAANLGNDLRQPGFVLVGHDAHDHGAQRLLLNIGRLLARHFGIRFRYVLLGDGPLLARYEEIGPCTLVPATRPEEVADVFEELARQGFTFGIANTTVSGKVVPHMKAASFRVVSLVHELPVFIHTERLGASVANIGRCSDLVVFAGKHVHDSFAELCGGFSGHAVIKPQGLYRDEIASDHTARLDVRAELGLPADAKIILNVGYGDFRKGFDLFTRAAKAIAKYRGDVYFVWAGKLVGNEVTATSRDSSGKRDNDEVISVGHREEIAKYYAAADVFFLSSREDPYPSVVLEAMAAGVPVVGFAGATGCEDLIKAHGTVVPFENIDAAAEAIGSLLEIPTDRARANAEARTAEIRANYGFKDYCFWLLQQFRPELQRVSVVVPSYNHERYLRERLESIFRQSYPIYQIVVLDDASTDGSVSAIRRIVAEHRREIVLIANEVNSGSLAKQWSKGLAQCTGDFVWIAESDDVADPAFLAECVQALERSGADFCFTDSWQINGEGRRTGDSYVRYVDDIEPGTFDHDFDMDGRDFLRRYLSVKNVILNMSGVLWRRSALAKALASAGAELESFRLAADWCLYFASCMLGQKVAYMAKPLNGHRRHRGGVTSSLETRRHLDEIVRMQDVIARVVSVDEDTRRKAKEHVHDASRYLGVEAQKNGAMVDLG